jgi:hypothetical protein
MSDHKQESWTTAQINAALREYFKDPEYYLLFEVANGTGATGGRRRFADALVMSVWPSRGLHLIGCEIKASRQDWLKEKQNPAKAESIARFCDFWHLVVGSCEIVKEEEIPANWGLLAPKNGKLSIVKQAAPLQPEPISRVFLASIFRAAATQLANDAEVEARIKRAVENQFEQGRKFGEEKVSRELRQLREEHEKLLAQVKGFEQATGVKLHRFRTGQKIGEAVNFVLNGKLTQYLPTIEEIEREAAKLQRMASEARSAITNFKLQAVAIEANEGSEDRNAA